MGAREVIDTLTGTLHEHGARAAWHDLRTRTLNRLVHLDTLRGMVVTVADVRDPALFEAPGFEGRFATTAELERMAADAGYDMPPEFLASALARGDRCYALFEGEKVAAYGWYSNLPTAIDEHFVLHFDPAYTYMYKGFTLPAYRGRRLHAVGMYQALRALAGEGRKGLISFVASNNFASLKSTQRMGYQTFGDLYLVRARGRCLSLATSGCAPYGFRAEPALHAEGGGGKRPLDRLGRMGMALASGPLRTFLSMIGG